MKKRESKMSQGNKSKFYVNLCMWISVHVIQTVQQYLVSHWDSFTGYPGTVFPGMGCFVGKELLWDMYGKGSVPANFQPLLFVKFYGLDQLRIWWEKQKLNINSSSRSSSMLMISGFEILTAKSKVVWVWVAHGISKMKTAELVWYPKL